MNQSKKYELNLSIIYFTFRVFLSICLAGVSLADQKWNLYYNYQDYDFAVAVLVYFTISMTNLVYTSLSKKNPKQKTIFLAIFIDILFCITFMHLTGGFKTGLAILLLSPITIAGIFFSGSIALVLAATAIIGMLLDVLYLTSITPEESKYFIPAGLLGILFFITSIMAQAIAKYIRTTEKLVIENVEKAKNLGILNETIVAKMQTGIIVIDRDNFIQLSNLTAGQLIMPDSMKNQQLHGQLQKLYNLWIQDNNCYLEPFRDGPGLAIIKVSFSKVASESGDTIIFIENQSLLSQQAQHLKLSSLGRLSASIAHEIRNPLNAISHASQLLLESNEICIEDSRLLNIINNHTKRINDIISNVLDLSRRVAATPNKIHLQPVIEKLQTQLSETSNVPIMFEQSIPDDFLVAFDETQFQQVLFNLIENALRHSAVKSGVHWVKIIAKMNDEKPEIGIYDQGHGINPEDIEKVFEPFYTTHNAGTGLGLYVARELCEMNHALLDYIYDNDGQGYFIIKLAHIDKKIALNYK